MNKRTLFIERYIFGAVICFFGGILDAFCSLYKNGTFCVIQTGNLIRAITKFIEPSYEIAILSISLFGVYLLACFLHHFLIVILRKKHIDVNKVGMFLIILLLIPSFFFEFDVNNILYYGNFITSLSLSYIGAIILTTFKEENYIKFSPTMMTGNSKSAMEYLADFLITKEKRKGFTSLYYILLVVSFACGSVFVALINRFQVDSFNYLSSMLTVFATSVLLLILSFIMNPSLKTNKIEEIERLA